MKTSDFIIVSNRLPVSVAKVDGKLVFSQSPGGLAKAMSSLKTDANHIWIGWPGISSDQLTSDEKKTIITKLKKYSCYPVFLTDAQVKNFYEGYANDTIWPLFHYFQSLAQFSRDYWPAYQEVNKVFYKAVIAHASPRTTVWIHDYHFMLLPQLIRNKLPESAICFFLHIPFPSFEVFRVLPNRRALLEGLLGADLVGFHTYDYAQYFQNSVRRTLGYEVQYGNIMVGDRVVSADAFPIGIDYTKFTDALHDPAVAVEVDVLKDHYRDKKIILSVDRLDYSKGIPNRLRAFEEFLQQNPEYHKKVSLVVIAVPSRTEVQAYKDLRETIEQMVSRINGTYATVDWTPISYQFKNIPFEQLVALYKKADVALVTPLRDGMNLVAKEYIACKQEESGVLVLSEFTGAADELQEAILINPNNLDHIVGAIKQALSMPEKQRKQRLIVMQNRISQYTIQRWSQDMMEQLAQTKNVQKKRNSKLLSMSDKREIVSAFRKAKRKALFLDYDGSLVELIDSPDPLKAIPSEAMMEMLRRFANLPDTSLFIISGRTKSALQNWFADLPVTLIAEHGSWIRQKQKWVQKQHLFGRYRNQLRTTLQHFMERTPGAFVEEKEFSLVWHYRNVSPELAYARNASLRHELNTILLDDSEVGVFSGNKIIEIKPRSIRKSTIVTELLHDKPFDFVLCAGDDYTDEDMFQALPNAYTLKVGYDETSARYQVSSVERLRVLLEMLLTIE